MAGTQRTRSAGDQLGVIAQLTGLPEVNQLMAAIVCTCGVGRFLLLQRIIRPSHVSFG
jgi:hypothetical protein